MFTKGFELSLLRLKEQTSYTETNKNVHKKKYFLNPKITDLFEEKKIQNN